MTPTASALILYAAWTLFLVVTLGGLRSAAVLKGARSANSFSPSGDDFDGLGKRITRAHANCYENLPVAGALMLYAIATSQTAVTDGLAYALVGARAAQSISHALSTSNTFVFVRFGFYIVQILILAFWVLKFLGVL